MIQSRIKKNCSLLLSKINTQPPNQICTNAITQRRGQVLAGPFSDVTSAALNSETISSLFSYCHKLNIKYCHNYIKYFYKFYIFISTNFAFRPSTEVEK